MMVRFLTSFGMTRSFLSEGECMPRSARHALSPLKTSTNLLYIRYVLNIDVLTTNMFCDFKGTC